MKKLCILLLTVFLLTGCAPATPAETTQPTGEPTTAPTTQPTTAPTTAPTAAPTTPTSTAPTVPTTPPTTAPPKPALPTQFISGSYYNNDVVRVFINTEDYLPFLEGLTNRGDDLGYYLRNNETIPDALYVFWEKSNELELITAEPVKDFVFVRDRFYIIYEADPTVIVKKEWASGEETVLFASEQGAITDDLGYYGLEYEGKLLFVLDHTYVYLYTVPENAFTLIYEDTKNINSAIYNYLENAIAFQDKNWVSWSYDIDTGERTGPID